MAPFPHLPVEIIIDIFNYLRPPRTKIGVDTSWTRPETLTNWWDKGPIIGLKEEISKETALVESVELLTIEKPVHPYSELLALRLACRDFDQLCKPFIFHDINLVAGDSTNESLLIEIIARYHPYFRSIRISAEFSEAYKEAYHLLSQQILKGVTSLGVYYRNIPDEWIDFNTTVIKLLEYGCISSFGIYSSTAFSEFLRYAAPGGATALLEHVTRHTTLKQFTSLEIAVDSITSRVYDSIRSQIGNLRSLTMRGAMRRTLGQIWDLEQQRKWLPSQNLTSLQLIHCPSAYAPHIPYVVRLFPLKTLFVSGCGATTDILPAIRYKGWSFKEDAPWGKRAPLEQVQLECVASWEVIAMGAIHTQTLIITAMVGGEVSDCFEDEEIFPKLQTLRIEKKDKDLPPVPSTEGEEKQERPEQNLISPLQQICTKRRIVLEYDAQALVFPR